MGRILEDKAFLGSLEVLYVEDNDNLRARASQLLQKIFPKLKVAFDGADGLEMAKNRSFDIVITDIKMPQIDGLSMAKEIKQRHPKCQIIITSAHEDVAYLRESIKIGIVDYIKKPIDSKEFLGSITKALNRIKTDRGIEHVVGAYESSFESDHALFFLLKNREIILAGRSFYTFFGIEDLHGFDLSRHIEPEEGFLHPSNWQQEALEDMERLHHLKLKDTQGEFRHFILRVSQFLNEKDEHVISLVDVSELGLLQIVSGDLYDPEEMQRLTLHLKRALFMMKGKSTSCWSLPKARRPS